MKLHLPTRLRAAVLACITAVAALSGTIGTGTITTGVVAYTMAASQTEAREATTATTVAGGTTYNGYVYTMLLDNNTANFHQRNFALATYEGGAWVDGGTYAGSGTAETPLGAGVFWTQFCATAAVNNSINYYGNTLHLGATSAQVKVTPAFTDFCLGGLVVEKGSMSGSADTTGGSAYWFYRGGSMQFNGTGDVNMDVADHVRFSYADEVAIKKSGVWNIASTGSISFDNNSQNTPTTLKLEANQHVTIQGGGKVNVGRNGTYNMSLAAGSVLEVNGSTMAVAQGTTTIETGAALTIGEGSVVTHSSVMNAAGTINNSGALTMAATNLTGSIVNAVAGSSLTLTGALTFDVTNFTTASAPMLDVSKGTFDYSGGSLALTGDTLLADGEYTLVKAADETAAAAIATALTSSLHTISNEGNVVKLTVASTGMEKLTEDLTGTTDNNFHKVCVNGLDVGEHTITATYSTVGYSTIYAKGLKGSGDITFSRTFTGNNLCVLWVDGDATEYTGTISMGNGQNGNNVFLKLGSANGESDLSNATVNMTKEVIALGNHATIGSLTANETEIRAVDGTVENIANMSTGMQSTTAGFAQAGGVIRKLTITTSGELTSTTLNSGVTLAIAQGASVTLAGGTMNGLISNSGALNLSGALTLNGPIMMGADSSATFASDVQLDLSRLTADEGVYHILDGAGTSNLGSLTTSNVTGIDLTGKTLAFDNSGTITLIDNTSDLIWKGGAGTWDETSQNWTKGGDPAIFADADRVTFNDESDVTLVGDLIAGGVNVNAAVTLEGAGSLAANAITIAETGSLAIKGDASVSVDRANINKMQVSGSGTLVLNDIGTSALAFDGGTDGFSGTLALNQIYVAGMGHSFTTTLTNFTGTVVIDALINHAASDFGDASKLVFVGSRDTNQIGFWCNTGVNPTLEQDIEIAGDNEVRFFLNGTTLNGDITGNKLRLQSGTGTFGGQVELNRLNMAQDGVTLNLRGDTTLGALVHDGNRTTLNVGDGEHQVTLNITGNADRIMNAKSHVYSVAEGSVINDNAYLKLTNSTLTLNGGGVYNVRGIELSAEGENVGNLEIAAGTTLHITGTTVSGEPHKGSFMVSHWKVTNTINLDGTIISEAGISGKDGTANFNINNGGLLQLNAGFVTSTNRTNNATLNVKDGGTLKVASTPTAYNDQITVKLENGSTFEGFAADGNATIAQNMTIVGTEEALATTNIKVEADKSLTLSGIISGENGALNKTGEGTLTLSGANTYAGGTTITAGTLDAVGSLSTGDVTVGSGATIILHNKLDATKLTNNGAIEIASGFSGLESAGVTKIDGGADGNGFNQGGTANLFNGTGVLEGTLSASFNGATVAVSADGTMTLGDDWGTYHINNALLETETFSAIQAAATGHSATLSGIDFALADQTLTVDADGFATSMVQGAQASTASLSVADGVTVTVDSTTMPATTVAAEGTVTLHMAESAALNLTGASTLNVTGADASNTLDLGNGTMSRTLSIVGATAISSHSGGTGFNTGTTFIGAGGTLSLTAGNDALGWDNGAAGTITLLGEAENLATLELGGRATMSTSIVMQGNSIIKSTASPAGTEQNVPALDPKGGSITVSGKNNEIAVNIRQRDAFTITVEADSDLTVTGSITRTGNGGRFTKEGEGTITFASTTADTLSGYKHIAGSSIFSGMAGLVFDQEIDASSGGAATGSISFVNGTEAKINSTLWLGGNVSILVDDASTVTKHTDACDLSISGVTGQTATIAGVDNNNFMEFSNGSVTVSNAAATVTAANAVEMAFNFASSSTVTNAGAGTLTLTNTGLTSLSGVNAQGGDITLNAATSIGALTIAGGKTVTAAATDPLSITTSLTAGAGATLSTALSIANSTSLDLFTGESALNLGNHAITLGTGLTITESMMNAITALESEQSLTLFKGVSSLTGGDMDATEVFSGLTGDFTVKVENGNLVVSAAALPAAELAWLGGNGTWGGESTPWTSDSGDSAYVEGANVTIGGESAPGGTIEVSGAQKAKNVTFASGSSASDKYVVTAASGASLDIAGNLIVNEGVSAAIGFLPTLGESSSIIVNSGAELDLTTAGSSADLMKTVFTKGSGEGTIKIQGAGTTADNVTLQTNIAASGDIWLGGSANSQRIVEVGDDSSLTVSGKLTLASSAEVTVAGGSLQVDGGIYLGHETAEESYKGVLNMSDGDIQTSFIHFNREDTVNKVNITGGTLTVTGNTNKNAFDTAGAASTVTISNATLTNGTTDMVFNHASTLTDAKITAAAKNVDKGITQDTTITVGGADMTTTLVGAITTKGKVTLAGTLVTDELTAVNNSGTLTIDAEEVTLAGLNNTGSVVVNGDVELTDATTTGGNLSAADVTLTGANTFGTLIATGTVTSDDTLTVGGGSDMAAVSVGTKLTTTGDVSIGDDASLAALSNTGHTLTVDGALTLTAATTAGGSVSADSLTLTGANTFETLTLTGAVTLNTVSYTSVGLTAGGATGNSLDFVVDQNSIVSAIGSSTAALTLANVTGLTSATINGGDSFKVGSREYTIGVNSGLVTITGEISDQFIWDATTEGSVWGSNSSWQGDVQPTADSNVVFNGTGIADVTVGTGAEAKNVIVESTTNFIADGTGAITTDGMEVNAGTLTVGENVTVTVAETTIVVDSGAIIIAGTLNTDALAATGKDVQLSGTLTIDTEGAVNSIGNHNGTYGKLIVGTDAELTLLDVVEKKLTISADSTVNELEVKHTGNLDAKGTFTVNSTADVDAGGVMTVAKDLTISDDLTNAGSITVGSAAAPATLATEDVTNTGTITVFNTMTSTGNVDNQTDATLDVKGNLTANTAGKTVTNAGNLQVGGTANATALTTTDGSTTTVKGNTTITGALNNGGTLTVGTQAAPAMLATGDVVNNGTITVYNTMTSTGDVTNKAGKTLDVKGNLTANAAGKTVNNEGTMTIGGVADVATLTTGDNATTTITGNATVATALTNAGSTTIGGTLTATNAAVTNEATGAGEKLTVTGALTADTLTTAAGATTEAKGGATLGTELANHGTTTVTGDLASADATAPITITNDATGAGEKLTVTGNVTAKSLTTQTDATTELTGTGKTVKLTDKLTNKGTTTIKGALTSADATATNPGSLKIENTGTLATGNLTADSLSGNGATTVTGNATMKKLNLGTTGALTASGTVKTDSVLSTGGSVTADTLDLSGLTAAATIADVKADKITLSGFNMLKVTDSIANENGTGAAKVMLTLDAATMSTLSVGDEKVVVATDGSVAGQGITLGNLAAVNSALKSYGIKGAMVTTAAGELVMQVQDNSFVSQVATSENGIAGAEMVDAASAAGLATAGTALGDVYAALDACRTTGDAATGDRLAAAVTGSSIAAMGSALSGDVERQLRAIRNRTTTMGVNQSVINENMPYVNAWVNAEGDYRKVAADGTMAGYKMMSWGGTVGMDVDFTPSFTAGLAATAMYGDFDAESEDHATGNIDTYYVSAFARYAKHRWTHTFVATAGLAETSLDRTILGHTVSGDSDGVMFGGMYEVGYVFALDKDATTCLQPVFNVSYTHASLSGYDESGANIGLTAGDVELNKLTVGLGARLQSVVGENIYNRSSILEARALVKFDAGDRQGETDVTFAGTGLPTHTTKSSETGAVGAEFGVGLTVPVGAEGGNLFVDASAEIRAEYTNVNATVGYRVNF